MTGIWQSLIDFVVPHLPYWISISHFLFWLFWGIVVAFIFAVIGWGFPALRSFCAAGIISISLGLTGYQMGFYDAKNHYVVKIEQLQDQLKQKKWR